ncbi:DNA-3-methyladenine glycosylase [Chitinophaga skermanii]|uniref:Putative 3-methyladenine DNA glycosylase n=1 Tax=Chitinophaga skermanii TaxID=331697 RepID=A0A327R1T1_9BACT|nr:DNA-3-methyladenine glycosylase [Chitinophaga skermanii]RAJ10620.1 DNA-3-methyladenine glycosylase [Chitinophaga skermanii]
MAKLDRAFYLQDNVVNVARQLLGCKIVTMFNGERTAGIIVDTEAYKGITDRASHAFNNRRTNRTEKMYLEGGYAYVYLVYGLHHLFNVVTNQQNHPDGVMLRAIEPVEGIDVMLKRCGKTKLDYSLTNGPGSLSKALGITVQNAGEDLTGNLIWIEKNNKTLPNSAVMITTRVGVNYAGDDAYLPYRFYIKDNPYRSKAKGLPLP